MATRLRPVLAALALLAAVGTAVLLDASVRMGIAQRLGLRAVALEYVPEVQINGEVGLWILGNPHALLGYQDAAGQMHGGPIRLAANTLLWQRGSLVLRLEGSLSKEEALRIAASMR